MADAEKKCPPDEALSRFFSREAGLAETEALADHMRRCPHCRIRFDALRLIEIEIRSRQGEFLALAEKSLREREKAGKSASCRRRGVWVPRAAAALLTLAAAAVLLLVYKPAPPDETLRSGHPAHLRMIAPAGRQARKPDAFRWSPVPGADEYFFELIDDSLETIVPETKVISAVFTLTREMQARLKPGRTYVWSVEARGDDGLKIEAARQSFIFLGD